jgi:serine protease
MGILIVKKWNLGWAVLLTCWCQLSAAAEYTDRMIVKLRAPAVGVQTIMSSDQELALSRIAGLQLARVRAMSGDVQVLRLPYWLSLADAQAVAYRLQQDPSVQYAEPDRIRRRQLEPDDTDYASQWSLFGPYGIQAPAAWDLTTGSNGVVVAVLDTGITAHAELAGRTLAGYDFISDPVVSNDGNGRDANPADPGDWITAGDSTTYPVCNGASPSPSSWHGTAIASLIGAASDNGAGIAGINWVSKILPIRVLGKCGGYTSDIVDGMRWAAGLSVVGVANNPNPAKILNLSLGGDGPCSATEQDAIDAIVAAKKLVVVAAGNDSTDVSDSAPANCVGVIAVASTTDAGALTTISSTGALVAVSAPGGELTGGIFLPTNTGTTVPVADTYGHYYGTSAAAASVSGIASLMFSVNSQLSLNQVRTILQSTVTDFPDTSCNTSICGAGIVNAAAAVSVASTTVAESPVPVPATTPAPVASSGGGGGGCTLTASNRLDPLFGLLLFGLFAWKGARRYLSR